MRIPDTVSDNVGNVEEEKKVEKPLDNMSESFGDSSPERDTEKRKIGIQRLETQEENSDGPKSPYLDTK